MEHDKGENMAKSISVIFYLKFVFSCKTSNQNFNQNIKGITLRKWWKIKGSSLYWVYKIKTDMKMIKKY